MLIVRVRKRKPKDWWKLMTYVFGFGDPPAPSLLPVCQPAPQAYNDHLGKSVPKLTVPSVNWTHVVHLAPFIASFAVILHC